VGPHTYDRASISFQSIETAHPTLRDLWNEVLPVNDLLKEPNS
jgi:hypothetical protein